mmetsp:Transcript_10678/g.17412  ORF Transcript_10678/g.17412 Transcript_10678/m.17412 type:complete len:234 (-) Transcript_10678:321-1022(-)
MGSSSSAKMHLAKLLTALAATRVYSSDTVVTMAEMISSSGVSSSAYRNKKSPNSIHFSRMRWLSLIIAHSTSASMSLQLDVKLSYSSLCTDCSTCRHDTATSLLYSGGSFSLATPNCAWMMLNISSGFGVTRRPSVVLLISKSWLFILLNHSSTWFLMRSLYSCINSPSIFASCAKQGRSGYPKLTIHSLWYSIQLIKSKISPTFNSCTSRMNRSIFGISMKSNASKNIKMGS